MVEGCDWSSCILTSWIYKLLIIDESGLPWSLNFTPLLCHVEVEHQAHQGTSQQRFLWCLNWIHLRVSWQGPSKGSDETCMWGHLCHQKKWQIIGNVAINHVNDFEKAKLFMKLYMVQRSTVNCKALSLASRWWKHSCWKATPNWSRQGPDVRKQHVGRLLACTNWVLVET